MAKQFKSVKELVVEYCDPDLADEITKRLEETQGIKEELVAQVLARQKAEEENERLRKALEPFAKYGDTLPKDARNKWPMNDAGSREGRGPMPTMGDCRRAKAILAEGEKK